MGTWISNYSTLRNGLMANAEAILENLLLGKIRMFDTFYRCNNVLYVRDAEGVKEVWLMSVKKDQTNAAIN